MATKLKEDVMKSDDVAKELGITKKKVTYLVKTGQIPHLRAGRNTPIFSRTKLLEWLQGGTETK